MRQGRQRWAGGGGRERGSSVHIACLWPRGTRLPRPALGAANQAPSLAVAQLRAGGMRAHAASGWRQCGPEEQQGPDASRRRARRAAKPAQPECVAAGCAGWYRRVCHHPAMNAPLIMVLCASLLSCRASPFPLLSRRRKSCFLKMMNFPKQQACFAMFGCDDEQLPFQKSLRAWIPAWRHRQPAATLTPHPGAGCATQQCMLGCVLTAQPGTSQFVSKAPGPSIPCTERPTTDGGAPRPCAVRRGGLRGI